MQANQGFKVTELNSRVSTLESGLQDLTEELGELKKRGRESPTAEQVAEQEAAIADRKRKLESLSNFSSDSDSDPEAKRRRPSYVSP